MRWVVDYSNVLKDVKVGFRMVVMVNVDRLNWLGNVEMFWVD